MGRQALNHTGRAVGRWEAQPGDVQSVNIGLMDGGDYKLGLKRVLSLVSIEQCNAQSS